MKTLLTTTAWELRLQIRHHILTISLVVALLYILVFRTVSVPDTIVALLIFSDPGMLGFLFVGALVLFEKSANTLPALTVTPLRRWQYLWAKALSLTLIALPCSLAMALARHGPDLNYGYLLSGVLLSSLIFVFLGFAGAVRVQTLNQYLIIIPAVMLPLCLPMLNLVGITDTWWFYFSPMQAGLLLLQGAFTRIPSADLMYAGLYLPLWVVIAYWLADRAFVQYVEKE